MKIYLFIFPLLNKLFTTNKLFQNNIELCEYNMDCTLPKICCKTPFVDYCCYKKDFKLIPIYK